MTSDDFQPSYSTADETNARIYMVANLDIKDSITIDASKAIAYILGQFDFKSTEKIMHQLDWKWKDRTVTAKEIKSTALHHLCEAYALALKSSEPCWVRSGGLRAYCADDKHFELSFELEHQFSDEEAIKYLNEYRRDLCSEEIQKKVLPFSRDIKH